jgi:serine protease
MRISVINFTKGKARLSQKDVERTVRAVNRQIREDFTPYWHLQAELRLDSAAAARPGDAEAPHPSMRGDAILYLISEVDEDDYLGFHERHLSGIPYGVVCTAISKELGEDWSVTLSHEVLELIADPEVNLLCKGPHPDRRKDYDVFHWREMCDAVQDEEYEIDGVKVANFVLPLYFTGGDELDGRNDFLDSPKGGRLRSFGVKAGGYVGFFDPLTGEDETFDLDERARQRARAKGRLKGVRRKDRRALPRPGVVREMLTAASPERRLATAVPRVRFEGYFLQVLPPQPAAGGGAVVVPLEVARSIVAQVLGGDWEVKPFWPPPPEGKGGTVPPGDFFVTPKVASAVATPAAWNGLYKLRGHRDAIYAEPLFEAELTPLRPRAVRASGGVDTHLPGTEKCDWNLDLIEARAAWALSRGAGVQIGHPDTGYTPHDEIASTLDLGLGKDFLGEDDDPRDDLEDHLGKEFPGHGTGTASVIASPEGSPGGRPAFVTGVAPAARIVPLRVSRSVILLSMRRLAAAIRYAGDQDLPVVSISMGGLWSHALHEAIRYATDRGTIVCAAAGNEVTFVVWPAAYEEVIAVAACNIKREPGRGTSSGEAVDVTAPGESVWRATADRGETTFTNVSRGFGTSYAVAQVAGAAALWLAHHGRPALIARFGTGGVPAVFKELLRATADPAPALSGDQYGAGVVNVRKLLEAPLPATAPARGMRRASIVAVPPRAGSFALLAHVVPEASRAALQLVTRKLLASSEDDLPVRLADVGEELAWHIAVDSELRDAVLRDVRASKGRVDRAVADVAPRPAASRRRRPAGTPGPAAGPSPPAARDLACAVQRLTAGASTKLGQLLPSVAPPRMSRRPVLCLRIPRQSGRVRRAFQLEGPWNVGDPVHETLTLHALRLAGLVPAGVGFDHASVWEFVRGAFWNDDPLTLLFDDDPRRTDNFSSGFEFLTQFKAFEREAAAGAFYGPGDSLLARTHFGDLQFLHAMAARDGETPQATLAAIVRWATFAWKVARGAYPVDTRLGALDEDGMAALRLMDGGKTIADLFHLNGPARLKDRALGSLLHLIQDSFASGHAAREQLANGRKGRVRMFFSYAYQDHAAHDSFDRWPPGKTEEERIGKLPGGLDAVEASTKVAQLWKGSAGVDALEALLLGDIFPLAPDAAPAGPVEPE